MEQKSKSSKPKSKSPRSFLTKKRAGAKHFVLIEIVGNANDTLQTAWQTIISFTTALNTQTKEINQPNEASANVLYFETYCYYTWRIKHIKKYLTLQ